MPVPLSTACPACSSSEAIARTALATPAASSGTGKRSFRLASADWPVSAPYAVAAASPIVVPVSNWPGARATNRMPSARASAARWVAHAYGLLVLTLQDDRISAVTRFGDNGLLARFGLPQALHD
ncbi:hypothetical protein BFF78_37020 [Streptomyces fodineus]|uniref:Uncharacterized protein n=1 Tax=Streptomyces fodineus TaxID=1904616 RepID=A0A1D7YK69_9ACTN|nr:hypothetical protein [Streptomyces fodineus]AOR35922.1 hypothetical protein BFF78_37020 [Streptomyces fodineus]